MYLTISKTAEYLSINESKIQSYIVQGRIRAVHDGEQYLINKNQFKTHLDQVEEYKKMIQDYLNEPLER